MLAHRVTPILNVSDIGVLCQGPRVAEATVA